MTEHDHKPLRCRSGYHAWTETHLESGEVHRHCSRCDEDEYEAPRTRSDESNVVGALVQGFGNAGTGG